MTSLTGPQLTLSLEPSAVDRWPTLREFIAHRVEIHAKLAKNIAADMDLSPGVLSKKLHPKDEDNNRFNVDDLERYLASTGDVAAVIEYLATKFMAGGDDGRHERALKLVETLLPELQRAIATLNPKVKR